MLASTFCNALPGRGLGPAILGVRALSYSPLCPRARIPCGFRQSWYSGQSTGTAKMPSNGSLAMQLESQSHSTGVEFNLSSIKTLIFHLCKNCPSTTVVDYRPVIWKLPLIVYACVSFFVFSLRKAASLSRRNFWIKHFTVELQRVFYYEYTNGPKCFQPISLCTNSKSGEKTFLSHIFCKSPDQVFPFSWK